MRKNSNLATEIEELYDQVDDLTNENRALQGILLDSSDDINSRSGRIPPINHAKDELMMELASVCEENKRLHIQIEKLKSDLELKEKDSKSMNRKLILLKDKLTEYSKGEDILGKISLHECTDHKNITNTPADKQVSKRTKQIDKSSSFDSIAGTLTEFNDNETMKCVQAQLEINADSGIGDSLGLNKEQLHIESDRSSSHSLVGEMLTNRAKASVYEKKRFELKIESLESSNENLAKEINFLKSVNKQIKQDFTMKLEGLQIMSSELLDKITGCEVIEEQMVQVQEQNFRLELMNKELQECIEDAISMKTEIEELKMQLETNAIDSTNVQITSSKNSDNKIFNILALKSEERDAFAEGCSQPRHEVEDTKMSIEDLTENVTGITVKGQGVAVTIEVVNSCYLEDRGDHGNGPSCELQEELDAEQLRKDYYALKPTTIQNKIVNNLKTECTLLRRSVSDLEVKNDNLNELNERLVGEKIKLQQQNKSLQEDVQNMGLSKMNNMEYVSNLEARLGRLSSINSRSLHEKLSSLTNVCAGLKSNLQITERDLSEWNEIGQIITENFEENQERQDVKSPNVSNIKQQLLQLMDEYNRLKCTEDTKMKQSPENEDIREGLTAVTTKHDDMNNEVSKLALGESQGHEMKTMPSKSCNERNRLQRDLQILTEKIAEYEESYAIYRDIIRGYDEFRFGNETVLEDKLKLEKLFDEHVKMLDMLQKENEMLQEKSEKLRELEDRENQQNIEIENLKKDLSYFEDIMKEHAEEQRVLKEEVVNLKGQIEKKESEILETRKENSEIRAKLAGTALEVEEMGRIKCEAEATESMSVEQRSAISNFRVQKAEVKTKIDSLRSKLGSLGNIRQGHDELIQELKMYFRKCYNRKSKDKQVTELVTDYDTRVDNAEKEFAEASKFVDKLSAENIQLIDECSSSAVSTRELQELVEESSKQEFVLEGDTLKLQKEASALKSEVEPKKSRSIDTISRVLARSKSDVTCYMSEYLDKNCHSLKCDQEGLNMKAQEVRACGEIIEKEAVNAQLELEYAKLKVKYEALKKQKELRNLERANEYGKSSGESSKTIRSFQERLDSLMQSNAKLSSEKIKMEKYLEEVVNENQSLNVQVSLVCISIWISNLKSFKLLAAIFQDKRDSDSVEEVNAYFLLVE